MEHSDTGRSRRGAYGLAVAGLESEERLLAPAREHWPALRIVVDPGPPRVSDTFLDAATARFPDVHGGHVEVDRGAGLATFRGVRGLTSDALVHPRLGMLAALYAHWLPDRMSFHAGAFVSEGRACAVVGERASGKSTLMGALALAGLPVVGDDTLVVEDPACLPGVRCVDLRPDAAARLDVRDRAVTVRGGARCRLPLPAPPQEAPLAGWVFLAWGDALDVRALPPAERLTRIASAQGWHRRGVTEPTRLLDAAALPAWELTRPRDWTLLGEAVSRVRELCSGARA
jgi:hypothetical protein